MNNMIIKKAQRWSVVSLNSLQNHWDLCFELKKGVDEILLNPIRTATPASKSLGLQVVTVQHDRRVGCGRLSSRACNTTGSKSQRTGLYSIWINMWHYFFSEGNNRQLLLLLTSPWPQMWLSPDCTLIDWENCTVCSIKERKTSKKYLECNSNFFDSIPSLGRLTLNKKSTALWM